MLLVAAKVVLLTFIIGGAIAIVIRGVRRSRANRGDRGDPRWNEFRAPPGHEASAYGATLDRNAALARNIALNCPNSVELRGIEPLTFSLRTKRSTN